MAFVAGFGPCTTCSSGSHEATHGLAAHSRRWNAFWLWACHALIGVSGRAYRAFHLDHHRATHTPDDPEAWFYDPRAGRPEGWGYLRLLWATHFDRPLAHPPHTRGARADRRGPGWRRPAAREPRRVARAVRVGHERRAPCVHRARRRGRAAPSPSTTAPSPVTPCERPDGHGPIPCSRCCGATWTTTWSTTSPAGPGSLAARGAAPPRRAARRAWDDARRRPRPLGAGPAGGPRALRIARPDDPVLDTSCTATSSTT
ncbi:MAG: fatty acid desaturase [Alphaproteobacteria bacterium]|nr:fatty acid desaturase [Alphaproteobacteria bacterium]